MIRSLHPNVTATQYRRFKKYVCLTPPGHVAPRHPLLTTPAKTPQRPAVPLQNCALLRDVLSCLCRGDGEHGRRGGGDKAHDENDAAKLSVVAAVEARSAVKERGCTRAGTTRLQADAVVAETGADVAEQAEKEAECVGEHGRGAVASSAAEDEPELGGFCLCMTMCVCRGGRVLISLLRRNRSSPGLSLLGERTARSFLADTPPRVIVTRLVLAVARSRCRRLSRRYR